jgi:hypothetical protein
MIIIGRHLSSAHDEEYTWMDEVVTSVEAQDPAFEIESQVDIRAPIVMQVLSDGREGMPDQQDDNGEHSTSTPSGLEDADAEWGNW